MYSYSQVGCFHNCPYQWKLRYKNRLRTLPNQDASNALYAGTALHTGLEKGLKEALEQFYSNFYVTTDEVINEAIKLEIMIPKARAVVPDGEHEVKLITKDFIGFIDLLVPVGENEYDIWDFKYSNAIDRYMESDQLHIYKAKFEETHPGKKIRKLKYLFVPKTQIRQKKTETLFQFRQRLIATLNDMEVTVMEVEFDESKVKSFENGISDIESATDYPKVESPLCRWCDYENYCKNGVTYEIVGGDIDA